MKKAFTLIELIFVIVVIGVLSAVAIPKFSNLALNAEMNRNFKLIFDTVDSIPAVYTNLVDLEQRPANSLKLEDLMSFMGQDWQKHSNGIYMIKSSKYGVNKSFGMMSIWYQDLSKREFSYQINCNLYKAGIAQDLCYKKAAEFGLTKAQASYNGNKITIKF